MDVNVVLSQQINKGQDIQGFQPQENTSNYYLLRTSVLLTMQWTWRIAIYAILQ